MKQHSASRCPAHRQAGRRCVWWKAWLIRIAAVAAALLVCGGVSIVLITDYNPDCRSTPTMIEGSFGSSRKHLDHPAEDRHAPVHRPGRDPGLQDALLEHRRRGPGAHRRVWRTAGCMILPRATSCPPAAAASRSWWSLQRGRGRGLGGHPRHLHAQRWGTNETLFTLMMNYVATQLVASFCNHLSGTNPEGLATPIGIINSARRSGGLAARSCWRAEVSA